MPIVDVELVEDAGGTPQVDLQLLADALGEVFASQPGGTWVRARTLPRRYYAENGGPLPPEVRPTFVSVLHGRWPPSQEEVAQQARQIAETVAEVLNRPVENVHVLYLPEGAGRIAFGGKLNRG